MTYVDGFVAAVPSANRERYRKHAEAAAVVFKEHGALRYVECWGDDVSQGKLTSFPMAGQMPGRRDRRLLVGHLAVSQGARRGHEEGDGRSEIAAGQESDALRWQTADLWRVRNDGRRMTSRRTRMRTEHAK